MDSGWFGWISSYVVAYICNTAQALKHIIVLFKQGYMIFGNCVYALYKVHFNYITSPRMFGTSWSMTSKLNKIMVVFVLARYFGSTTGA